MFTTPTTTILSDDGVPTLTLVKVAVLAPTLSIAGAAVGVNTTPDEVVAVAEVDDADILFALSNAFTMYVYTVPPLRLVFE